MMPNTPGLTAEHVKLIGDLLVPRVVQELRGEFQRLRTEFSESLARQDSQMSRRFAAVETRIALLESPENKRLVEMSSRLGALERLQGKAMLGYGFLVAVVTWTYHLGKDALWRLLPHR